MSLQVKSFSAKFRGSWYHGKKTVWCELPTMGHTKQLLGPITFLVPNAKLQNLDISVCHLQHETDLSLHYIWCVSHYLPKEQYICFLGHRTVKTNSFATPTHPSSLKYYPKPEEVEDFKIPGNIYFIYRPFSNFSIIRPCVKVMRQDMAGILLSSISSFAFKFNVQQ